MDFEGFLRMVGAASHDSLDSLDQYENRMGPSAPGGVGGSGNEPHFTPELDTLEEMAEEDR